MTDALPVPCAGVLFDCDGVLVDSTEGVESAWSQWAQRYGFVPADVLALVHGRRAADTMALLLDEERREAALALINELEIAGAPSTRAIAGAPALTASMPAGRWAVVTSGTRLLSLARLAAAGIGAPGVVVAADDVSAGKPDPEGYRTAAARLGLDPGDLVVLEDVAPGVAAARAAGVRAVVGVGRSALGTDADLVVPDLSALRWCGTGLSADPDLLLRPAGTLPA